MYTYAKVSQAAWDLYLGFQCVSGQIVPKPNVSGDPVCYPRLPQSLFVTLLLGVWFVCCPVTFCRDRKESDVAASLLLPGL